MISGIMIAGHFLRAGVYPLVALALAFPLLLLLRRPWATRSVQILLVLSGAEWLHTLFVIAAERQATGQP